MDISSIELVYLNLSGETPHAEPHVGRCGDGEGKPPCYPIRLLNLSHYLGKKPSGW